MNLSLWDYFFTCIALLLVIEGILPFSSPQRWRIMMIRIAGQHDNMIRGFGFMTMIVGALLMYLVHLGIL